MSDRTKLLFALPGSVFVKVVEANGSYAAGSAGSKGGLIHRVWQLKDLGWSRAGEAFGFGRSGNGQGGGAVGRLGGCQAVVDVGRGVQADAGMACSWLYHCTKSAKQHRASARQPKRSGKVGA
jgi:hypothetical protein